MRARSTYTLDFATAPSGQKFALVRDLDQGASVTNDAENVVPAVLARQPVDRIIYRDTDQRWDELLHDGRQFLGFAPIRDAEALTLAVS